MTTESSTELIEVGNHLAKVRVNLIVDESGWSPYFSHEDALKLNRVRRALKAGDIMAASREAEVFELKPVAADGGEPATTSTVGRNKGREAAE